MTKIMILNGPKGAGKDTAAEAIQNYYSATECAHMKISAPLKQIVATAMNLPTDFLEKTKDVVLAGHQVSYRDAQIHVFNQLCPIFGNDWLGKSFVARSKQVEQPNIVVSDGGKNEDMPPIIQHYRPEDILIVQILREGHDFSGDIRSYISGNANIRVRPIVNQSIELFTETMIDYAGEFFAN